MLEIGQTCCGGSVSQVQEEKLDLLHLRFSNAGLRKIQTQPLLNVLRQLVSALKWKCISDRNLTGAHLGQL